MFDTNIQSMFDLAKAFPDEQSCISYLEQIRWAGRPVSPFDPKSKVYKCAGGKYKCKNTGKYFNVRTGTMYDNTKISLQRWFLAVWIITSHKKGISSIQLGKDIGVTQKTAWFMLQRIRACFGIENNPAEKFEGIIECDETFVGGKNRNRHRDKKVEASQGRSFKDKTPVIGILQRGEVSKVKCIVARDTKRKSIQPFINKVVERDAVIISDEWHAYKGLENRYDHHVVDHGKKQYVDYDNSEIHSNSIEGFWGILKRAYNGIYNWWSRKHMQKYVDEFVFRFNLRKLKQNERFNFLNLNSGVRTKYKELVT
jgi:transposase-like protein